jgi:5'-methylthioadenosine phosphorylase
MTKAVLGIIGGSGIYDLPGLTNAQTKTINSPWGKPSAALLTGEIDGLPFVFLSPSRDGIRLFDRT